ncbi:MAG: type III-B CRISPR module-associated protein Cmr5, partial [Eubacterium sp.]
MNKRIINEMIPKAYTVLETVKIAKNGKINENYRGQISSFGASVIMGSLLPAVAYFSEKGNTDVNVDDGVDRRKIINAITLLLYGDEKNARSSNLFSILREQIGETGNTVNTLLNESYIKEKVINAAIALKLAMN